VSSALVEDEKGTSVTQASLLTKVELPAYADGWQFPRSGREESLLFEGLVSDRNAGINPVPDNPAHPVTPLRARVGSFVLARSMPAICIFLLLSTIGSQAAMGQTPKNAPAVKMEGTRPRASAENPTAERKRIAIANFKRGDFAHAREQFETLNAAEPRDVSLAVLLGYTYVKLGLEPKVVDLLTPLEAGNQNNMDLEYVLAFSLIQTGKFKEGVSRMERVARTTRSANAYVIAGSIHLQQRKMPDALTDLNAALRLDPTISGLSTMIGQAQFGLGELSDAVRSFHAALRANPADFTANLDLGAIRLKEKDFKAARPLLEFALQLQPKFPLARLEMAKLNIATSEYVQAVAGLEGLVKDEPNWFEAHWQLAIAYFELGRPEDGKRERMLAQQLQSRQPDEGPDMK